MPQITIAIYAEDALVVFDQSKIKRTCLLAQKRLDEERGAMYRRKAKW